MRANEKLKDKIFDEMIKQALKNNADKIDEQYPSNQEFSQRYTLSESFEKRMQRLFKQEKRKERLRRLRKNIIKIAAAALLCIAVSFVTVMSVDAFRVSFLNFISELKDTNTRIGISGNEGDDLYQRLAMPTYLPDGFENVLLDTFESSYIAIYRDTDNNEIHLQQLAEGASAGIDSEDANHESLIVNEQKADYYEKQGEATLVYKNDEKIFLLQAPLPKNEVLKIAESME